MRKTISLVLVAAMLLTMMVFAPTTASAAATLDANNVQIEAQYFGGTLLYSEIEGTNQTGFEWYAAAEVKAGDPTKGTLNIDGIISEGEWTEKVYHIDSDYAPYSGLAYGNNILFEVPSAENTFYRWLKDGNNNSLAPADGLEYDVRFMWDEEYFYIAVEYLDVDGYINAGTATAGTNWDGDSIQFRLDPAGANAVVGGQGYDASVDSFPYDPEINGETDTTPNCTFPWDASETTYSSFGEETHSTVGNFVFSYYTSGYTDMCDTSKRYFPEEVAIEKTDAEGNVYTEYETQYKPADISSYGELGETEPDKIAYATVYPHDANPHPAIVQDQVTYEIALPWALVADDYVAEAGNDLGFSMVRFNAQLGKGAYNSYLAWGSGICGYETKDMPQICGGSNSLVLTDEAHSAAVNCEHTFADATCVNPETCTACGYERGFVAGHKYAFSDYALPNGSGDGSISAVCTVCGDTFTKTLGSNEAYTRWDFLETDTTISDHGWYADGGFCIQWETLDENGARYTDETDPTGTLRQKLWNDDGTAKNAFDNKTFGYAVADLTIDGQTGTYFEATEYSTSYTEAMEVYFTELPLTSTIEGTNVYNTYFGNWFGGDTGVKYLAGLVNVEDQWFFAIYPSAHQNPKTLDEFYENALSYTEATAEQIATDTWHDYVFMFDNAAETAMLFWDNQLVAAASDYHFPCQNSHAIFVKHNAMAYVKNVEVGSTGLAAALTDCIPEGGAVAPAEKFTVTINGVATEVEAGATVELTAEAFYTESNRYYRFAGWNGDVDGVADAAAAATTVTVDGDITIDASYIIVGDITGDGNINAADSNTMRRMAAGQVEANASGDVDGDGKVLPNDSNLLGRMIGGSWFPTK